MAHQFRRKPVGAAPTYEALLASISATESNAKDVTKPIFTTTFLATIGTEDEVSDSRTSHSYQNNYEKAGVSRQKPTTWGIHWRKPTFIISMLLLGLTLSLVHHFYYNYLNGRVTGDAEKQAWPTRIGTGLAFLVTSFLKAGTIASLGQYIWRVVKRKPLTISSLDKLFSMSTDPLGLFYWELMKGAKIALFLGVIVWLLGLASVAPAATLTIVAKNITSTAPVATLNWTLPIWMAQTARYRATLAPNTVGMRTANDVNVVALPAPVSATEWSYDIQFYGPSLQCNLANSTEQVVFDNVTKIMENDENIFTYPEVKDTSFNLTSSRLLYSAWSAWLASETPNSWLPRIINYGVYNAYIAPQIFIQTSTQSIVCNSVNASFDITISFVNGIQQIIQKDIQILGNYSTPYMSISTSEASGAEAAGISAEEVQFSPYLSHLYAIGSILTGNITLPDMFYSDPNSNEQYAAVVNTNILTTGLTACDDIAESPFKALDGGLAINATAAFMNTFPSSPWMCRNQTLMAAIQDLANNITISYLSSPAMTGDSTLNKTILTSNTVNTYEYRPFYLFVSYSLALLFSFIAAIIGFYSIYSNGVSHSTNFSAIVAATRNPELDSLTGRSSLGADPMQPENNTLKLKLGPLFNPEFATGGLGYNGGVGEQKAHVAFGLESSVGQLRKGELYS